MQPGRRHLVFLAIGFVAIGSTGTLPAVEFEPLETDAEAPTDNVIVITGRRRESTNIRQSGQSLTVKPEDATRFDTITHLKRESSVVAPETGRISPSGFVVPKVRGQDVKLTDVYLEDILLQDPYSGLPLIEDLDLRAFGSLEIHQGVPPPEVPGLNPIGTLRYRFLNATSSSAQVGTQVGRPFGAATWALGTYHHENAEDSTDGRLYVRGHRTRGQYTFYSDEGTPYNESDDRLRERENNDQKSIQAVPFFRKSFGPLTLQTLGWIYSAGRGLPSQSVIVPSSTRESANGHLGNFRAEYRHQPGAVFHDVRYAFDFTDTADQRSLSDPGKRFLTAAERSEIDVRSRRGSLGLAAMGAAFDLYTNYEHGSANIASRLEDRVAVDIERTTESASLGTRFKPVAMASLEAKAAVRHHFDEPTGKARNVEIEGKPPMAKRHGSSRAFGGSGALGDENRGIYVQTAFATRLPSLIEEFGNGSSIRPNSDLRTEDTHHRELGAFFKGHSWNWRVGSAVYEDKTGNKIIFVPVMASAVKAMNVRQTKVRGVDVRFETKVASTTLYASFSRLFPYDETRATKRLLPGIPERVAVGELTQELGPFTARWLARYRSSVYRDQSNSVELPGATIQDASVDFKTTVAKKDDVRAGLSVRNVFDVLDVSVEAPATEGSKGRTAYSDVAGGPLPGRQWVLSLAVTL